MNHAAASWTAAASCRSFHAGLATQERQAAAAVEYPAELFGDAFKLRLQFY